MLVISIMIALALYGFTAPAAIAGNSKYAGIVIDAKTGKTLYSHQANAKRYPASLTKMMTLYMMFEALADGKMSKKTRIRMSKHAASMPPSKLGIKPGGSLSAEQAVYALVTKSANDVAAAVAEHLGGTESGFAKMMTGKARELGMNQTTFRNASGLPNREQLTTARDMAQLGVALREHFPQYYSYFSTRSFKYGKKNYGNHNRLLGNVKGVDGIKTGYTRASGFNLVSSVQKGNRSIVAVVLGGRTGKSRNAQMKKLISGYFGKATSGQKQQLVASRKSGNYGFASSVELPKTGPLPIFRNRGDIVAAQRVITAHSVQTASLSSENVQAFAASSSHQSDEVSKYILALSEENLPVPSIRPSESIPSTDPVVTATVAENYKPGGWQIQIGATDSNAAAINLLNKAQTRVPGILKSKSIYTETVAKGSSTLHRARFVGFDSKAAARDACKELKRKKFACLALAG